MRVATVFAAIVILLGSCSSDPERIQRPDLCRGGCPPVRLQSLLDSLVDVSALGRLDETPFRIHQFSSYDRRSVEPGNDDWFANRDRGHYLRVEERNGRTENVMAELDGPGAIVRVWSANPQGTLRIYLDGEDEATIAVPMEDFVHGRVAPFVEPFTYWTAAQGGNSFFPIPFSTGVLVTLENDVDDMYYHVGMRVYPRDADVETYSPSVVAAARESIDRAAAILSGTAPIYGRTPDARVTDLSLSSGVEQVMVMPGGGVVRELVLTPSDLSEESLRGTRLVMRFDGNETVNVPFGDFFGTAPGPNPFETMLLSVSPEGTFSCRFPMPFAERATIRIEGPMSATGRVVVEPAPFEDDSLLFHARWFSGSTPDDNLFDLHFLTVRGQGHYAGTMLSVANSTRLWWGEGDERIWVDDDAFPSIFGTGTEDYFGYANIRWELFDRPYHAQPRADGPENYGHVSNLRLHVVDRIPFDEELRFDLEVWRWGVFHFSWAGGVYFYARPGSGNDVPAPADEALVVGALFPPGEDA